MKKNQKCPKCGSTDIGAAVELNAGGANTVYLEVCRKKLGGLVQPVEAHSKATAYVCRQCGFVEIYADTPSQF
jgi:predicted nucleic-acid-binding Zn-ribbon protein